MIRVTLRQFRTQLIIALTGVAGLAVLALLTHRGIQSLYDTTVANCSTQELCDRATSNFLHSKQSLRDWFGIAVVVTPGLLGVFWGAPLVAREVESGTFRLAWTQSVTRTRWLLTKLAVIGLAVVAVSGLVSLIVTRWSGLYDGVAKQQFGVFDMRDIAPIGHALFAFCLGVTLGAVMRRLLPAMATTLVVFVAVSLAFATSVRPNLLTSKEITKSPTVESTGFGSENGGEMTLMPDGPRLPNAWVHSVRLIDSSGKELSSAKVAELCPKLGEMVQRHDEGPGQGPQKAPEELRTNLEDCVKEVGKTYVEVTSYHAADRYWPLQWMELGIFTVASFALVGLSLWWVRKRLG